MSNSILVCIVALLTTMRFVNAQEPRNKIKLIISPSFAFQDSLIGYQYSLKNDEGAEQSVWKFWIITSDAIGIVDLKSPAGWNATSSNDGGLITVSWGSPGDRDILPASSLSGFDFFSNGLPGLVKFYAEGYTPPPTGENDSIPGYHDLTPHGPGIVGTIVGPVFPPFLVNTSTLFDTLISYKHQALNLGWIKDIGTATSLDQKLDNAKAQLAKNNKTSARNILQAFVDEVEAQKDKHLTSEAYALLKFNAEYLISKLTQ